MHPRLVDAAQAFLLVVDLQEAFRDRIQEWKRVLWRTEVLIRGARRLELPVLCTEQYPRGLGSTVEVLRAALGDAPIFEKKSFSALGAAGLPQRLQALGRRHAIVCGIETHACINHTVHDLLDWGMRVHLPADAVSAQKSWDHEAGYQKAIGSGAIPGSVESILLECMRGSDHPAFRDIQALLKSSP
jgi:nicotinamidase-related amidase